LTTEEAVWAVQIGDTARIFVAITVATTQEAGGAFEIRGAAWLFVAKAIIRTIKAYGAVGVGDTIEGAKPIKITEGVVRAVNVGLATSDTIPGAHLTDEIQRALFVTVTAAVVDWRTLHNKQ